MTVRYFFFLPLLCACITAPRQIHPEALSLEDYYTARWEGDTQKAYELILPRGWEASQNVQGERERQDLLLAQGLRSKLTAEVENWRLTAPESADLLYLETRLLQDSVWAKQTFLRLSNRFPENLWLALGAVSLLQRFDEWAKAELALGHAQKLLGKSPSHPAKEFFRVLRIRQLQTKDIPPQLYQVALASKSFQLLGALHGWARNAEKSLALAEVKSEIKLLQARPEPESLRAQALLRRLVHKVKNSPDGNLTEALHFLEEKSMWLNLPTGWPSAPLYSVAGLARLVQPEASASSPAGGLLDAGQFLLLGSSPVTGLEALALLDVDVFYTTWNAQPIHIITSADALATAKRQPIGGAVFKGFYMRRDLSDASADALERSARLFPAHWEVPSTSAESPPGMIPADGDLPKRIRRSLIGEGGVESARRHQWRALAVHEAGHLPDILPLLFEEQSPWALLPATCFSWVRWEDPLSFLEYRAQLRALASGEEASWLWAETLEVARNPRADYFRPYRTLTLEILRTAKTEGWPMLPHWTPEFWAKIPVLAQKLLKAQGLKPLPADDLRLLLSKVDLDVSVP